MMEKRSLSRWGKLLAVTLLANIALWGLAFVPAVQNVPYWLVTGKTYEGLEALSEKDLGIPPLPQELRYVSGGRTHYVASYLATRRWVPKVALLIGDLKEHVQRMAGNWSGMGGYVDEGNRLCNRLGVQVALKQGENE